MANFVDILDKPAEEIKAPPPLPVGTYVCVIDGPHEFKEQQNFKICEFKLKILQAMGDVDAQALSEAGGVGRSLRHGIFLNDREGNTTEWSLLNFLEAHLGIDKSGKTLRVMLSEAPGRQVLATIKHALTKDSNPRVIANIASTAKI